MGLNKEKRSGQVKWLTELKKLSKVDAIWGDIGVRNGCFWSNSSETISLIFSIVCIIADPKRGYKKSQPLMRVLDKLDVGTDALSKSWPITRTLATKGGSWKLSFNRR